MKSLAKYIVFILVALNSMGSISVLSDQKSSLMLEKLVVSLVIDTSGSMASTDPTRLRETAANIFIDLLSPEDNLGVITFNTQTVEVIPMQQVGSTANKGLIKSTLAPSLNAAGDTHYQAALQAASNQLSAYTASDVRKVIIFLTDGVPDPNPALRNNPGYMDQYMNSMWATVSEIGLKQYPVYSVGFGAVNQDILNRISADTQGSAQFISDPGELAVTFFNVLSSLKNRRSFLASNLELAGEQALEFDFDTYTSQITMVFANAAQPLSVSLVPPEGKSINENVVVQTTDRYTLVTMNQATNELSGKWTLKANGAGLVRAFGDKDLFLKAWVTKPQANTQQPVNEPMEISVQLTGEVNEKAVVEALVIKNGTPELNSIILEEYDGVYMGIFDKPDVQGTYEIAVTVKEDENLITSTNSKVTVRELPVLKTDFFADKAIHKLGDSMTVTGYLEMRGNKITASQDISISTFSLLLKYADGTEELLPLVDNQDPASGDIKSGDGTFTVKQSFVKEGQTQAALLVQGIYKGENFIIDKALGSYEVVQPGTILVNVGNSSIYGVAGSKLTIPMTLISTSKVREIVTLSVDTSIGMIDSPTITIEPEQTIDKEITLTLVSELENTPYQFVIEAINEDPLTAVETGVISLELEVITKSQLRMMNIRENLPIYIGLLGLIIGLPLIIMLIGIFLYSILVKPNIIVRGMLLYHKKNEELVDGAVKEIPIRNKRKNKVSISFNENNAAADFYINGSQYKYDIVLENEYEFGKWRFIAGYRALAKKVNRPKFVLYTTQPGIFEFKNEVMTKKELFDKDAFESGGYVFQYYAEKHMSKDKQQGKDLLEGRM
ncbi:vWA domain-containing protein [Youngiibacter multivorans]|uniref:Mg-chelatase subunit ChlD n=1 Tax=Youngiibacter multivorans TaxID=937251 RepID=A0ABS4G8A7_9CLOT|nr:vWA domain-containing protein [Youngiibacter multivorans]MBP1920802.1 Mg-chelatase subunit ChlD [Youngiibacter multivorans]